MSKISVIIPTYEHADTIAMAIRSALCQTFKPFEIIVVDDGSTDGTKEVLAPFLERGDILYHYQDNAGSNPARNKGFELSSGDFVIFLDADIMMEDTMLEELYNALREHPDRAYAYSGFSFGWKNFKSFSFDAKRLKQMNFIHTSALIRREAFPGFDDDLLRFQDWDLWLTMLEQGNEGVHVPKNLFKAFQAPGRSAISSWRPSFFYKMPWSRLGFKPGSVHKYDDAKELVLKKHQLWT